MGMRPSKRRLNWSYDLRVKFPLPVADKFSELSAVLVALLVVDHHVQRLIVSCLSLRQ